MIRTGPDLNAYSRWVRRVLKKFKDERDWGITKVAQEGNVSRALLTNWRDANWTQGKPTRGTVERFCDNLRLDKAEPFGALRFALEPARDMAQTQDAQEPAEVLSASDLRIRQLEIAIDRPGIKAEQRRDLEVQLVRLKAAKQANEDAERAADEALKRHKAG